MSYFDNCKTHRGVGKRGLSRWDYEWNSGMNGVNPCFADRGGHPTRELGIELDLQLEKMANLQTERVIATRNRPCGRYNRAEFSHNGLDDQIFYDVDCIGTSKEEYEAVRDVSQPLLLFRFCCLHIQNAPTHTHHNLFFLAPHSKGNKMVKHHFSSLKSADSPC